MKIPRPKTISGSLNRQQVTGLLLVLYLALPFMQFLCRVVLRGRVEWLSLYLPIAVVYFPLIILCIKSSFFIIKDFIAILFFLVVFLLTTFLFHPEYEYWYTRQYYGVWNYVLRPDNGLYIYLFIRLVNDPKELLKYLKSGSWIMYIYLFYRLFRAMRRGYWTDQDSVGQSVQVSYSLSYGYDVLLFDLVLLYSALESKKFIDWAGAIIGLFMILIGGSRGPFLDIGIFLVLYLIIKLEKSRKKVFYVIGFSVLVVVLYFTYDALLLLLVGILDRLNISSRFLYKLISGDITNDSGRLRIWSAAIDMIKQNPFGYGAMGTRHVIGNLHIVGHPHQFFLEVLVDFGVFFGSIIIIVLMVSTVKILRMKGNNLWKGIFIIFFGRACQLLVSLTYWHSIALWGVLAVGMCIHYSQRKGVRFVE